MDKGLGELAKVLKESHVSSYGFQILVALGGWCSWAAAHVFEFFGAVARRIVNSHHGFRKHGGRRLDVLTTKRAGRVLHNLGSNIECWFLPRMTPP